MMLYGQSYKKMQREAPEVLLLPLKASSEQQLGSLGTRPQVAHWGRLWAAAEGMVPSLS